MKLTMVVRSSVTLMGSGTQSASPLQADIYSAYAVKVFFSTIMPDEGDRSQLLPINGDFPDAG